MGGEYENSLMIPTIFVNKCLGKNCKTDDEIE